MGTMKTCSMCNKQLEANLDNFYRDMTHKDRLASSCKPCRVANSSKWQKDNRQRRRDWANANRRRTLLQQNYGLTIEEYEAILASQGGVCAICKQPPMGKRKHLFVDHDHATNKNRGLLCGLCNAALERMESIPDWHEKAINYLTIHALGRMEKEFK